MKTSKEAVAKRLGLAPPPRALELSGSWWTRARYVAWLCFKGYMAICATSVLMALCNLAFGVPAAGALPMTLALVVAESRRGGHLAREHNLILLISFVACGVGIAAVAIQPEISLEKPVAGPQQLLDFRQASRWSTTLWELSFALSLLPVWLWPRRFGIWFFRLLRIPPLNRKKRLRRRARRRWGNALSAFYCAIVIFNIVVLWVH